MLALTVRNARLEAFASVVDCLTASNAKQLQWVHTNSIDMADNVLLFSVKLYSKPEYETSVGTDCN